MKAYARIAAFLLALLAVATMFVSCTNESTTDDGTAPSSPSVEESPSTESPAPQLSVDDQLSMPVFEW